MESLLMYICVTQPQWVNQCQCRFQMKGALSLAKLVCGSIRLQWYRVNVCLTNWLTNILAHTMRLTPWLGMSVSEIPINLAIMHILNSLQEWYGWKKPVKLVFVKLYSHSSYLLKCNCCHEEYLGLLKAVHISQQSLQFQYYFLYL